MTKEQTKNLENQLQHDIEASDCTYGEIHAVLRRLWDHYQDKGREYLGCTKVSDLVQIAATEGKEECK